MQNIQISPAIELKTVKSVTLKAGIYTSLGLILYFSIMKLFNLQQNMELHYLNIIVLFLGLRYTIKHIIELNGDIKYFEGLKSGLIVTIISVITFNVFMLLYVTVIDPSFLDVLKKNVSIGNDHTFQSTVINMMGILTIEGLSSGFIMTYMLMQYYKDESSETK